MPIIACSSALFVFCHINMKIREINSRIQYILKNDGFLALCRRCLSFIGNRIFKYEEFAIHLHYPSNIRKFKEVDFTPAVDSFDFLLIKDNAEADRFEAQGFEFRSRIFRAREALEAGGVALTVFIGKQIASINWLAFNKKVQAILGEPPIKIDFAARESITSGAQTLTEFRGKRLFAYTMFKSREILHEYGILRDWGLTSRNNSASGSTVEKFQPDFKGYGCWLHILGLQFYWERRI
ncbi:MAG: hypothetical protein A2Z02_04550 [Chloroflexi bacterium RBG_16_48_7]|nr:MAG: hypothetical protein A2Z02_04550 [Chloroflexi bacterium RBG_16_48_7]